MQFDHNPNFDEIIRHQRTIEQNRDAAFEAWFKDHAERVDPMLSREKAAQIWGAGYAHGVASIMIDLMRVMISSDKDENERSK